MEHIRRPVRFAESVRLVESLGATRFVEVGPGSGLTAAMEQSLSSAEAAVVAVLGKDRPELARCWVPRVSCLPPGWGWIGRRCLLVVGGRRVELPTYAFSGGGFGWRGRRVRLMWLGRVWWRRGIRCWVRWWRCLIAVGWC